MDCPNGLESLISVIRALNMDPNYCWTTTSYTYGRISQRSYELTEKSFAGAWEGKFGTLEYEAVMDEKRDVAPTVDWENGTEDVLSGAEIYKMIFESNKPWMLSSTEQSLQQNMKVLFLDF